MSASFADSISKDETANVPPTDPLFSDEDEVESCVDYQQIAQEIEIKKGPKKKEIKKKGLKPISPKYHKMTKCNICATQIALSGFCDLCVSAGFDEKFKADPESVNLGIWQNGQFLPFKRPRKPVKNMLVKSNMENFQKIRLIAGQKNPTSDWCGTQTLGKRGKNWSKNYVANKTNNVGIPTGKLNGIIVLDLDFHSIKEGSKKVGIDREWWRKAEIPFIGKFGQPFYLDDWQTGDSTGFISKWDTLTVKTANTGLHMFFKWDAEIPSSHKHSNIDIQSDGYYVVGAGSKVKDFDGEEVEYSIIKNSTIKPMPEDLKKWVLENCYTLEERTKKAKRDEKLASTETDPNYYKYLMTDDEAEQLSTDLKTADAEYYTDTKKWRKYSTAMKVIGKKEIWAKWSESEGGDSFEKEKNEHFWNSSNTNKWANMLQHIFKVCAVVNPEWEKFINLIKLKATYNYQMRYEVDLPPIPENRYLSTNITIDDVSDYIIHASTGTGKTTLIKETFLRLDSKFINLVSRKSLGYEQYTVFVKAGVKDMVYYGNYLDCPASEFPENKNVCIQIDSIMKLHSYMPNIHKYDVFLDEYSSLIEYLVMSDTLKAKRIMVFKLFVRIIRGCRRVICADADITSYTVRFLTWCGRKPIMIRNNYEMALGRPAQEIFSLKEFEEKLLKEDKYILATDTKTAALSFFHIKHKLKELPLDENENYLYKGNPYPKHDLLMGEDEKGVVVCLTSDNDGMVDLDDFDRVIFSPKIIYGLDSTMRRPVYCFYEEKTITPRAMLQQVARCRDPTELNFMFMRKRFIAPVYLDYKETEADLLQVENIYDWETVATQAETNVYKDIMKFILYNDDCYMTNPYLHFIEMVKTRGWDLKTGRLKTSGKGLGQLKKDWKEKETGELFDPTLPGIVAKNEYIKVPQEKLFDLTSIQKQILTRNPNYEYYITFKYYLFKNNLQLNTELDNQEDFVMRKMSGTRAKIVLMRTFLEETGCQGKLDLTVSKAIAPERKDILLKAIINQINIRITKRVIDLSRIKDCQEMAFKMFKQIFGPGGVKSKRIRIDGKSEQEYSICEEWLEQYYEMCQFSMNNSEVKICEFEDYDDGFDQEHTNITITEPADFEADEDEDEE